jgi:hypothetical protein
MKVNQFTHHASGRTTLKELPQTKISTGASSKGNAKQWETIRLSLSMYDSDAPLPHINLSLELTRDEAERVARQIGEYLVAVK